MRPARRLPASRWLLLGLPFLLYCLLPTRNYYWDGVAFAIDIEKHPLSAALVYPSHLIYEPFGGWLYRLSQLAGLNVRALFLMQGANCVLAGLTIFLLDKCLRLRGVAPAVSVAWALVFGFSATWWRFASDANAYVPAIFLILCADVLLEKSARGKAVFAAGLCAAGAMLFHQLAILFVLAALVRLRPGRDWLVFLAVSMVPVALLYWIAFHLSPGGSTAGGFFAWLTWHSPDSSFTFHPLTNAALSLRGSLRLLFGGRFGDFVGDGISRAAAVALVVAVAGYVFSLMRRPWPGGRGQLRTQPGAVGHLLVWLGVYVAFLFFWMPQNTFYRLFYLAPSVLLLAWVLPAAARATVWSFAAVLALWNFAFLVYPQSRIESDAPLRFALAQRVAWRAGTPIVYRTFHPDLWTISYFNQQAAWIGVDQPGVERLQSLLGQAEAKGRPLYLEETAYLAAIGDPAVRQWIESHERVAELASFRDDRHNFRFHCMRLFRPAP